MLVPPLISYNGPIPLFQLPPFSEWSSVDYMLYLSRLSRSFAVSLRFELTHSQDSGIHT